MPRLLALFITCILVGCIAPQEAVEPGRTAPALGLGLDVPGALPAPRAFQESPKNMANLQEFLLDDGYVLLKDCGNAEDHDRVSALVSQEKYHQSFGMLIDSCGEIARQQSRTMSQRAMQEGNEAEVLDELHREALAAMAAVDTRFNATDGPGNAVEATVLRLLMHHHYWNHAAIDTALNVWGYYENGTASGETQLVTSYLNLLGPRADSETLIAIMDSYPWSGDQCRVPDVEALEARVRAKLDHAVVLAKERGDPEDANYVTENYGALVKSKVPRFEYYAERDWWVAMMHSEVEAEIAIAYWENLTAAAWPTEEEAEYMLALYRNQTRTIVTENLVRAHEYIFYFEHQDIPGRVDWANDTVAGAAAAPGFLSVLAARSPYTDMNCTTEG